MNSLKPLFLFGFIILHAQLNNNPIWFNTDHIVTVSENTVYKGATVRTINNSTGFIVKETFDVVIDMISKSKK